MSSCELVEVVNIESRLNKSVDCRISAEMENEYSLIEIQSEKVT